MDTTSANEVATTVTALATVMETSGVSITDTLPELGPQLVYTQLNTVAATLASNAAAAPIFTTLNTVQLMTEDTSSQMTTGEMSSMTTNISFEDVDTPSTTSHDTSVTSCTSITTVSGGSAASIQILPMVLPPPKIAPWGTETEPTTPPEPGARPKSVNRRTRSRSPSDAADSKRKAGADEETPGEEYDEQDYQFLHDLLEQ
jgi:hypothetical protein